MACKPALLAGLALLAGAAAPATLQPGKWEVTKHPKPIPLPHALDADAGEAFRAAMSAPETTQVCLKRPDLAELKPLFVPGGQKACTATNVSLGEGAISANAQCAESGRTFTGVIEGKYTPTTIEFSVKRISPGLDKPGTIAMTVEGKRVGGC